MVMKKKKGEEAAREAPLSLLSKRYLSIHVPDELKSNNNHKLNHSGSFGLPFTFGQTLAFHRPPPPNLEPEWYPLNYLDPYRLWGLPQRQTVNPPTNPNAKAVSATVINHCKDDVVASMAPPPAQVTISRGVSQPNPLWPSVKVPGIAVREYGKVVPANPELGSDGGYVIVERIDYEEARRRAPEAAAEIQSQRERSERAALKAAEEAAAGSSKPVSFGGDAPSFTMGGRTSGPNQSFIPNPKESEIVPGPGSYEVHVKSSLAGPAFSLRGRPAERPQEVLPGPNHYQPSTNPAGLPLEMGAGPAWTMRGRPLERFEDCPGPGEYDLRKEGPVSGPAPTITGRPKPPPIETLPGPGQYSDVFLERDAMGKKAPAFTMGLPIKPLAPDPIPDPGQYDLPEAWRVGGGFSLKGKAKERPAEDSPGPGEYHSSLNDKMGRDAPAFTMRGRLPDVDEGDEGSPGPGDHFNPETDPFLLGKGGPAFTIRTKVDVVKGEREEEDQRQMPGPGHFIGPSYIDPGSPSAPSYTIRGRVKEPEAPPSPGPAQYDVDRGLKGGPAFTMRARPAETEAPEDSPGPGHFDPNVDAVLASAPSWTLGVKRDGERDEGADSPAPGDYMLPRDVWNNGPAFTMRPALPPPEPPTDLPGPGQYLPLDNPLKPSGPAFTLAMRLDPSLPQDPTPAPGDYEVDRGFKGGPAFTMRAKAPEPQAPPSPAPGDYHVSTRPGTDAPAFTIQTRPAYRTEGSDLPGPGQYHSEQPLSDGPAFTMRARPKEAEDAEPSPGPGHYEAPLLDKGPAWTLPSHLRPMDDPTLPGQDSPGPGAYSPTRPREGPAYTMRGRPKEAEEKDQSVGPGEYDLPPSPGGPAYTMRAKAKDPEAPPSPGPADYLLDRGLKGGPAFTIKGRHQECEVLGEDVMIDPDIPGPGTYGNPNVPGKDQLGKSGPAYTFRPKLPAKDETDGPGPGEHGDINFKPSGPAYTLGSQLKGQGGDKGEGPGPGDYSLPNQFGEGGPAFTLGPRFEPPKPTNQEGPAPGDYHSEGMGSEGPAYTLGAKLKEPGLGQKALEPGPGQFHREMGPEGPAYTMGKRFKSKRKKGGGGGVNSDIDPDAPAPGDYYHEPSASHGPAFTFGAKAAMSPADPSPGAGDYHLAGDPSNGPAWTHGARRAGPSPDPTPPPGYYSEVRPGAISSSSMAVRDAPTATSFGYSDLYGATMGGVGYNKAGGAGAGGTRRRVMFDDSTRFRDSTELALGRQAHPIPEDSSDYPSGNRGDVRGTMRSSMGQPGLVVKGPSSSSQGRPRSSRGQPDAGHTMAPLPGSSIASTMSKGRGRPGTAGPTGRRAHKALEEAAAQAANILASTTVKRPQPTSSTAMVTTSKAAATSSTRVPPSSQSKIKYETKRGAGGGLFTFANIPSSSDTLRGGLSPDEELLVAGYTSVASSVVSSRFMGKDGSMVASEGSRIRNNDPGPSTSTIVRSKVITTQAPSQQKSLPIPPDMEVYHKQSMSSYSYSAANVVGAMVQKEARRGVRKQESRQPLVERATRAEVDVPAAGEGGDSIVQRYNLYVEDGSRISSSIF